MTGRPGLVLFCFALLVSAPVPSQEVSPLEQSVRRLNDLAAREPPAAGIETRLRAAQAVWPVDPELGRPFVHAALTQLRTRNDWVIGWGAMQALLAVAPDEVAGVLSGNSGLSQRLRALAKAADTPDKERTARELAAAIDQLPAGKPRLLLASELCRLSPASIREISARTLYRATMMAIQ